MGLPLEFVVLGEVGFGRVWVLFDEGSGGGDLERGGEALLFDGVVKVTGEAVAGL